MIIAVSTVDWKKERENRTNLSNDRRTTFLNRKRKNVPNFDYQLRCSENVKQDKIVEENTPGHHLIRNLQIVRQIQQKITYL